ncbi:MAG TPA: ABC transporter permease [Gemmatimonadaceae bacterium]|nr:ABC transporter permease [Gemmatimonadaceae bacterium]
MLRRLGTRIRSLWNGITRSQSIDAEMQEEFRLHLEMRTEDLVRRGVAPDEAARLARLEFGKTDHHREDARRARGLGALEELRFSLLDLKLGARMLVKYPGLTFVGGLGIAIAIAFSTTFFAFSAAILSGLPLDEGDRIVGLDYFDTKGNDEEQRIIHDVEAWRTELKSITDIGARQSIQRNLFTSDGRAEPVTIAEMSASGFRLARVPAMLGRHLLNSDEIEGAPPVLVIGHDVWRARFGSDSSIIGRQVRLGSTTHTIVGVMPRGFAFPLHHQYWTPLRLDASDYERRRGPALHVFGRLVDGASLEAAQAELRTYSQRMALDFPRTHKDLQARVMPYQDAFGPGDESWMIRMLQLLIVMLVAVVCTNVATLVYARTAARHSEIAVRTAIGASRSRIVGHLFAEGLVLSTVSAAVGIYIAKIAIDQINDIIAGMDMKVPFWMTIELSPLTVIYAMTLAALAALIVGVTPALKATGKHVNASLQRLSSGATGLQLGRTWTALIIAQAAFAVAVIPFAVHNARLFVQYGTADPGFLSKDFLLFRIMMDRDTPTAAGASTYNRDFTARYRVRQAELEQRLESEPEVSHLIRLKSVPGTPPLAKVEVEGGSSLVVGTTRVDISYFDAFNVPMVSGRAFNQGDAGVETGGEWRDGDGDGAPEYYAGEVVAASTAVIVNRSFANEAFGGANALGRRLRYAGTMEDGGSATPMPWYEIVGVVNDFPAEPLEFDAPRAVIHHPIAEGELTDFLAIRLNGVAPSSFGERLRQITATVDPSVRVHDIRPFDVALREEHLLLRMSALGIVIVTASVLLLTAAGIYALMSFTVERRRREIGIRIALGADRSRVVRGIFGRALRHLAIGVGAGAMVAPLILRLDGPITSAKLITLVVVSSAMLLVGVMASVGPTRRSLRIQPTEALKER